MPPLLPALPTPYHFSYVDCSLPLHRNTTISVIDVQSFGPIQEIKTDPNSLVTITAKSQASWYLYILMMYLMRGRLDYLQSSNQTSPRAQMLPAFSHVSYMYIFFYFYGISKISTVENNGRNHEKQTPMILP